MKAITPAYFILAALAVALVASDAQATPNLENILRAFDENPQKVLESLPQKIRRGNDKGLLKFSNEEIRNGDFVTAKNIRREIHTGRAAMQSNDRPENLVDNGNTLVRSLVAMDNLKSGKVAVQPWSDYYWALYNGETAYRYADPNFPGDTDNWKKKADYILGEGANFSSIDLLSPAEKYDLLVGDTRKSLTHAALGAGEVYYRSNGKVETWMGICHGWAPAAYMLERPTNAVTVTAADGKTKIKFFPSDIKALSSLLWANNSPATRFIGGRCNAKKPKKDRIGRITDQDCFDTNPGAWHQSIVNQIGVKKRSFVMDATFDYEVWNQPVSSYQYSYFNPQTMKPVATLEEAKVAKAAFSKDKFKSYRANDAAYVVGVSMDVDYIVETDPSTATTDSPAADAITQVSYQYDLELDANMNIIGGEWYQNAHPDFLWTPGPEARIVTSGDQALARTGTPTWNGTAAFPREWTEISARSAQQGVPLATIVEKLIQLANSPLRR